MLVLAINCANPGTPTGGPRDRKPPVLVSSKPAMNATGFTGNIVTLVFDENVQVKDAASKFVVSPPTAAAPKVDAHGNVVRVRFDGELMPATTYTLDFADCLSDLNEGNVYEGFTFTFSTGESYDTLMISGNLYDAQNIQPCKGVYVLLHSNVHDTAFTHVAPMRIAKTDDYGRFAIKNVPADANYRIYALDDKNRNFMFDQPGEMIAWYPHEVRPSFEIRQIKDSICVDSLSSDTAQWVYEPTLRDTLVYTPDSLILFAFAEEVYDQYIVADERKERRKLSLMFNKPMSVKPQITFPGQDASVPHAVTEYSVANDTCTVWLTDSLIYQKDSVVIAVRYQVLDTLKQMADKTDTLTMWHFAAKEAAPRNNLRRGKKDAKDKKPAVPTLKIDVPNAAGVYGVLPITASTPFHRFDWSAVRLFHKVDTIFEPLQFTHTDDTVNIRRKAIRAEWVAGDEYRLEIDSAAVADIYGLACNKVESRFNIKKLDSYGTLYINVDSVPANGLLQLLTASGEKVARQNYLPANGKAAFRYLKPGDYMIRIVTDSNRNGKWDTGNYADKIEPERVMYYMEKVTVRANWDIKVEFETRRFTPDAFARKFRVQAKNKKGGRR